MKQALFEFDSLLKVFLTKDDLCIVMEYAPGGDLHQYVKIQRCLPEEEARWFFQQLVVAVEYCHKKVCSSGINLTQYNNHD